MKRLYRSETKKIVCGVCGGFGEYFDVDPTLVRVLFALFTLLSGVIPGVFFYIVCCLLMPKKSSTQDSA